MSAPHHLTLEILRSYYPIVLSLREYLTRICDPSQELEKPGDSEDYVSLVKTSYVALPDSVDASLGKKFRAEDLTSEMYEVIDRVQVKLFQQAKGKPMNVLTMGYRGADSRGEYGRADMSRQAITNFFTNTNITELQKLEWRILLTRIGEAAMYHLLLNANVFVALPNACFCQLVGTPITELRPNSIGLLPLGPEQTGSVQCTHAKKKRVIEEQKSKKRLRPHKPGEAIPREKKHDDQPMKRSPTDIQFPRARIFYARPVYINDSSSKYAGIVVGFPPKHVLNRLAYIKPLVNGGVPSKENIAGQDARHLLKHIFPRQFKLQSPFYITQEQTTTSVCLEDYTSRDEEIQAKGNVKTPKRLKPALELVHQLIKRHWCCDYRGMRATICPSKIKKAKVLNEKPLDSSIILELMSETSQNQSQNITQTSLVAGTSTGSYPSTIPENGASAAAKAIKSKPKFAEFTCTHHEVFRYMMKVTSAVIPKAFWGCQKNFKLVMKHVNQFIRGRRYETTTLHSVLQGFSTQECDWLLPISSAARHQRATVTDALKRRELVEEFLYWYFESFVIPLLKTTFYATESNAFRGRVLYFRQDDWTSLCRPLLERLTEGTFKRLTEEEAQDILQNRKLGYSFVRLLPKETGVRPIVNLRRRSAKPQSDGSPALSINRILQAAFQILTYEKITRPDLLGASVFGPNETFVRFKSFKVRLFQMYGTIPKLYFVKVDVRTCFDTIEQEKLLEIVRRILSEDGYMIQRYSRVFPVAGKIKRSFGKEACPDADHPHFLTYAAKLARLLRHAIFVDQVVYPYEDREEILQLLKEHLTENIVKIGQYFYRQTVGIPQGSVLSAILCSFFYGDLETKEYKFTTDMQSMLCRLIDDYLFITTEESKARRFLAMMNAGHPEYGCFISPEKTLTNFDIDVHITNQTPPGQKEFPWCGYLINMNDLCISVDYTRYAGTHIGNTLTVDRGRRPGVAFRHKMLQMARQRSHLILCDTALNTDRVVHRNIYQNFLLSAVKMHCYLKDWGIDLDKNGGRKFLLDTIHKMIRFTYMLLRNKAKGHVAREHGATCFVKEVSVTWLGTHAFWTVLKLKPRKEYKPIIKTLGSELKDTRFTKSKQRWDKMVNEARGMLQAISW